MSQEYHFICRKNTISLSQEYHFIKIKRPRHRAWRGAEYRIVMAQSGITIREPRFFAFAQNADRAGRRSRGQAPRTAGAVLGRPTPQRAHATRGSALRSVGAQPAATIVVAVLRTRSKNRGGRQQLGCE